MTLSFCTRAAALATALGAVGSALAGSPLLHPAATDAQPLPRSLTPAEARQVAQEPIVATPSRAAPPGLVRTAAEYEPMEGIMLSWQGSSSWLNIVTQMARDITTLGDAKAFVIVPSTTARNQAQTALTNAGADMSRVEFTVRFTNSIWIRDYGPRYVYKGVQEDGSGGVRAVVDHTYNRPRPSDNALPSFWANQVRDEPYYLLPLVHGGGNYHLESGDPEGVGHATRLIVNENPGMTEAQVIQAWRDYQNLETVLYTPYPTGIDSTQHIDMWMIPVGDNRVIISEWVNEPGSSWNTTSNNAAAYFASRGFEVFRTPAVRSGGTHYTYTNAVICNDLVLIPTYTNATASPHNATALAVWQQAFPGKTVRQINCQALVTAAGVMHCIVMHVPAPAGGDDPTAYVTTLNDAETLDPGTVADIAWLTDGPRPVVEADILLSTDSGLTFPTTIVSGLDASAGSFAWTVPDIATSTARVRVVVRDELGHEGVDDTDLNLTITGAPACPADLAEPLGEIDIFDLFAFLDLYNTASPAADFAEPFGEIDVFDLFGFLGAYNAGCP